MRRQVPYFQRGMMNGMAWGQSDAAVPWLLKNCYIENGYIRTRFGHDKLETEAGTSILAHLYKPSVHYVVENDTNVSKFGHFVSGSVNADNIYDTGTADVDSSTGHVTLTGADDIRDLLRPFPAMHKFRYDTDGLGTWSNWLSITSVANDGSYFVVSGATATVSGNAYEIALLGAEGDRGKMALMGERYIVSVFGGAPLVYDRLLGESWPAGIPAPDAPSGSYSGGLTPDTGWYAYAVAVYNTEDQKDVAFSDRLVVEATASKYNIDILVPVKDINAPNRVRIYRTLHQADSATAQTAQLYLLTEMSVGSDPVTYRDIAADANVNTSITPTGTAEFKLPKPSGEWVDVSDLEDIGWYAYACSYVLYSGEEGPVGERLIVQKSAVGNGISLTLPDKPYFVRGINIYRTKAQNTYKDAEEATLYHLYTAYNSTSIGDVGHDENLNLLLPAPVETGGWLYNGGTNDMLYSGGRLYIACDDSRVRMSGLVKTDIEYNRGDGLDEPNYWTMTYVVGQVSQPVKALAEYRGVVYAFTGSGVYALDTSLGDPDVWYFAKVVEGVGCSWSGCAVSGVNGIYAPFTDQAGNQHIVWVTGNGRMAFMEEVADTLSGITTWYQGINVAGNIYWLTDAGVLVFNERTGTWHLDTGVTPYCASTQNGVLYAGDGSGNVWSMYTKTAGTQGDEGSYEWVVRTGAYDGGSRISLKPLRGVWVRLANNGSAQYEVRCGITTDGYAHVEDIPEMASISAGTADMVTKLVPPEYDDILFGVELRGTGGYGDLKIVGYGFESAPVSDEVIGE